MIPFSRGERVSDPGLSKGWADEFERKDRIIMQIAKEILSCIFFSIALRISLSSLAQEKSFSGAGKIPQTQILKNRAVRVSNQMA
jgi:hypothetical protein